ncbi:MAG: CvpA family protein [Bacteroidetes bacterium]|nr:CvpA family protein [Bacteroidota bacterium]
MNFLDILFCIPLIWFAYKGFSKGFVVELASLIALILAVYCGVYFSNFAAGFLVNTLGMGPKYTPIIAFIITFILVLIIVFTLAKMLEKSLNLLALGIPNKILGVVFGLAKTVLVISVILLIFNKLDDKGTMISKETRNKSMLYNPISSIAPIILPKLKFVNTEAPKDSLKTK